MLDKVFTYRKVVLLLVSWREMDPALCRMQELLNSGELNHSHPNMQEIKIFSKMFGKLSEDPACGINIDEERVQGMLYLQDRMRRAKSGKEAMNIYLGKHGVGSGRSCFKTSEAILPEVKSVFHFAYSPSASRRKQVCPALADGVLVQFLLVCLEIVPAVTRVKLTSHSSVTMYASIIFDGKGINPGAQEYDGVIHGILPPLSVDDVKSLTSDGYPNMLRSMIQNFKENKWSWVKQVEVFLLQLLDLQVAIPIASYSMHEKEDTERFLGTPEYFVNFSKNEISASFLNASLVSAEIS